MSLKAWYSLYLSNRSPFKVSCTLGRVIISLESLLMVPLDLCISVGLESMTNRTFVRWWWRVCKLVYHGKTKTSIILEVRRWKWISVLCMVVGGGFWIWAPMKLNQSNTVHYNYIIVYCDKCMYVCMLNFEIITTPIWIFFSNSWKIILYSFTNKYF